MNEATPPVSVQPPFFSKLPLILIGSLLILSAGVGGVYLGKYLYAPKALRVLQVEAPTAIPTVDPTANWRTYKFVGYSLSFKYPDSLKLDELTVEERPSHYKDSPYVRLIDTNASMTITPNGVPGLGFESTDYETVQNKVEVNGRNVEISGAPIYKTRILYKPTNSVSYFISVKNPNNDSQSISISYTATSGDVSQDFQQIFGQILSTFQFTDSASSQNYTCPANGYINCMPVIESSRQWQCGKTYLDWVRKNCPDFKGVTQ